MSVNAVVTGATPPLCISIAAIWKCIELDSMQLYVSPNTTYNVSMSLTYLVSSASKIKSLL